ncbi:MAG: LysM peptidoglycan-binding domain-containing protein, partial [Coxiellaceae bacterium]|nr:LysM peptidoglycan-binding domain-containing protein [Coxiellaceae bacterium]
KIPGPKRNVHKVKQNENLWTIAARYHVKPSQIRYWNHIGYRQKLQPNQELVIWKKHHQVAAGYHTVTVKRGDSLSHLGDHYHTTANAIMHLNHLRTSVLQIGQQLKIPYPDLTKQSYNSPNNIKNKIVTHTVRPGQSLSAIAHYYHVSTYSIVRWNHLQSQKYLHVGEKLKIYIN